MELSPLLRQTAALPCQTLMPGVFCFLIVRLVHTEYGGFTVPAGLEPRTDHDGRTRDIPRAVGNAFGADVDYAELHKI